MTDKVAKVVLNGVPVVDMFSELILPHVRRAGYVCVPVGMYEQVVEYLKVGVMEPALRNVVLHMDAETLR